MIASINPRLAKLIVLNRRKVFKMSRNSESKFEFPNHFPKAATGDRVVQETGDELLIYDLDSNRAVCLNKTAALVWQNCDGKTDITKITERVEKKLGQLIDPDLVHFALGQLHREGLLVNGETLPDRFAGLSRREVVKRIGFGSLVALPIVSAIVAPQAAFAQSCVNPGGAAPGSTGNGLTCGPSAAGCAAGGPNTCTGDPFFLSGCCSGTGVVGPCSPFGAPPAVTCTCLCGP